MRSKIAIVLAILGLVVLGLGIGQRTIWLPPATITAGVEGTVAPAPLTVIDPDVLNAKGGNFTMTIKASGPIQLAVARQRDITGWVGDAAHTSVTGVNGDFTALTTESKDGAQKVPNPAGSDMWVSEEKGTGELSYTFQSPGHGDWALLVSSDGTAPAPTDIALTTDNDAGTPWAVPLMIIGSALLALAALLFWIAPRKPQAAAVAGRRAAGRTPPDTATGSVDVDRLAASREQSAGTAGSGHATIADTRPAARHDGAGAAPDAPAANRANESDHASALPTTVLGSPGAVPGSGGDAGGGDAPTPGPDADPGTTAATESGSKSGSKSGKNDGGGGAGGTGAGKSKQRSKATDKDRSKDGPAAEKNEYSALPAAVRRPPIHGGVPVKARWGAALAAVLVAGTMGPAVAADPTTPAATPTASSSSNPSATGAPTAGFPVLLDSQVERIADAVATVVASGDNAKNAKELQVRVAGMALQVRSANYSIRSKVAKQAAVDPVNSTKLLARVVTTDSAWPRSAMIVTQGEGNALPQLLTLVQASARENYKLVHATPLLPGQTFPAVQKEGAAAVPLDSATGLQMSPNDAIAALSDRLTKADSKFKATFKDGVYISSVLDTQAKVLKEAKDANYVFSHKADAKSALALRTADGGAMVVVGYTFAIDATSKADATLTIGADAAAFTGGTETTKGFVLDYAEPVVMYIPPATAKGQLGIVSADRHLVGAKFK